MVEYVAGGSAVGLPNWLQDHAGLGAQPLV